MVTQPQELNKKIFVKLLFIGDTASGKTTLLCNLVEPLKALNVKPTIGADFMKKEIMYGGKSVSLQIWDTAGLEKW